MSGRDYTLRALGAHDAVVFAVANHKVGAGGLSLPIYQRLIAEGSINANATRIIALSPAIPEYMWTFREGLDAAFRDEIKKAFLGVTDPAVLKLFRADAFVPAADSDVNQVRDWIAAVGQQNPEAIPGE